MRLRLHKPLVVLSTPHKSLIVLSVPVLNYSVNTTPAVSLASSVSPSRGGQGPGLMIIQRRVLWLIGCVCGELPDELYGPLYEALLSLLERGVGASGGDLVVRLAAVSAFKALVERWGFGLDKYTSQENILGRYLTVLYAVLRDANEFDTRSQILTLISDLIERLGDKRVVSCIDVIVKPLPNLWESSRKQNLLRSSILGILRQIVEAVGALPDVAPKLHSTIYPLIAYSIDTRHPESIYLSDDGLALWEAVLKATPIYVNELHNLFSCALPLLEFDLSRTKIIMSIMSCYILIGGREFMKVSSNIIINCFKLVLENARSECAIYIVQTMDLILQCYPKEALLLLKEPIFLIINNIVETIRKSTVRNSNGGAANNNNIRNIRLHGRNRLLIGSLSFFARMLLQTPTNYQELLNNWNALQQQTVNNNNEKSNNNNTHGNYNNNNVNLHLLFLNQWIRLFDQVGGGLNGPWRRKLWSLALTMLWSIGDQDALKRGTEVINIFMGSISGSNSGSEFYLPSMDDDHSGLSLEAKRKIQVLTTDVVHSIDIKNAVTEAMNKCATTLGAENFNRFVTQNIDGSLFGELKQTLA